MHLISSFVSSHPTMMNYSAAKQEFVEQVYALCEECKIFNTETVAEIESTLTEKDGSEMASIPEKAASDRKSDTEEEQGSSSMQLQQERHSLTGSITSDTDKPVTEKRASSPSLDIGCFDPESANTALDLHSQEIVQTAQEECVLLFLFIINYLLVLFYFILKFGGSF